MFELVELRNVVRLKTFHEHSDRLTRVLKDFVIRKGVVEWKITNHPQDRLDTYGLPRDCKMKTSQFISWYGSCTLFWDLSGSCIDRRHLTDLLKWYREVTIFPPMSERSTWGLWWAYVPTGVHGTGAHWANTRSVWQAKIQGPIMDDEKLHSFFCGNECDQPVCFSTDLLQLFQWGDQLPASGYLRFWSFTHIPCIISIDSHKLSEYTLRTIIYVK